MYMYEIITLCYILCLNQSECPLPKEYDEIFLTLRNILCIVLYEETVLTSWLIKFILFKPRSI